MCSARTGHVVTPLRFLNAIPALRAFFQYSRVHQITHLLICLLLLSEFGTADGCIMSFTALDAPDRVAKQAGPVDFTSLYKGKALAIRVVARASIRAG